MKRFLLISHFLVFNTSAAAQPLPDYYTRYSFLLAPASAFDNGLVGFANPANLTFLSKPEVRLLGSLNGGDGISLQDWGLYSGFKHLGLSVQRQYPEGVGVTDFRFSSAFGTRDFSFGLGYGWSSGDNGASGREKLISGGAIWRPLRFLSLGLSAYFSVESSNREGVGEVGVRPFGNSDFTVFGDLSVKKGVNTGDTPWSLGAAWQAVPGVQLVGRYFESSAFTVGMSVDFGKSGLRSQARFASNGNYALQDVGIRLGEIRRSFAQLDIGKGNRYVPFILKGRTDYLKFSLFDDTQRFFKILQDIQAASEDPRVGAIALNLSSASLRPEHAWEIRLALQSFRESGKKVVVFIDSATMTTYHLASMADVVALDPQGSIMLEGYALGRTYLKGTLDKLGLGFDEWRFFKYKSANETYSREDMSEADREQLQEFVDDWYGITRADITRDRSIDPQAFDELVDNQAFFTAARALETGLADTLARWSGIDGVLNTMPGGKRRSLGRPALLANSVVSESWGRQPQIALVYALGVCAMDEGIKARSLESSLLRLARNRMVKAVVVRVDSPGGDGMASDLVAEAIKKCAQEKPVIISQGQVAASGGYWISIYGDKILAGANTVAGSIGVIGGWVYDQGFSEKLGLTADLVQRGKHADLGRGVTIPFTGIQVPARNLDAEERIGMERIIKEYYDDFIRKVAAGREISEARVREIAEGRVYSGEKAKELGLVDEIGGLMMALSLARSEAGLEQDEEAVVVEIPKNKGLIDFSKLSPLPSVAMEDPVLQFLKLLTENPGRPLPVLLPGTYPDGQY